MYLPPSCRARATLTAILLAAAAAGCPSRQPPPDPNTLTIAAYTDFADQVGAALAEWRQAHPRVKVNLVVLPPADFTTAITLRLMSDGGVPDVLFVDASFLARLGPSGTLADLSGPPLQARLAGRFPAALAREGRIGEAQVGVPMEAAPAVLFYRADVLGRASVSEAELTASWEGFVSACARIQAATGTYCLPRLMDLAAAVLHSGLRDGESPFFSEKGEAFPDGPRLARALRLAGEANAAGIAATAAVGSQPWVDLVRGGRMAVQLGGPTMVHRLERLDPGSAGKWRLAPLPGAAAVPAPAAFCALAARGAHRELASDVVRRACLTPGPLVTAYHTTGAVPALLEAANDPALDRPVPFLGGQVIGPALRAAAERLPYVPASRHDVLAVDVFNLEMDHVVHSGKTIEAALADARAEVERRTRRTR